jgi:hypothetical protein
MAIWSDLATWVGPTPNRSGSIARYLYVVEHIAEGSYDGTIAWQRNPDANVSSHFVVARDGRIAQMVDTAQQAWTQIQGNPYSISIENEGFSGNQLTAAQVEASARILARANREHGIPLQLTGTVGVPGLGHHSMGAESGVNWGHSSCPGEPIKAQKPAILARAIQIAGGTSMDWSDSLGFHIPDRPAFETPVPYGTNQAAPAQDIMWFTLVRAHIAQLAAEAAVAKLDQLLARPPVQPAPVDVKALVAALKADPEFFQLLVDAANRAEDT